MAEWLLTPVPCRAMELIVAVKIAVLQERRDHRISSTVT